MKTASDVVAVLKLPCPKTKRCAQVDMLNVGRLLACGCGEPVCHTETTRGADDGRLRVQVEASCWSVAISGEVQVIFSNAMKGRNIQCIKTGLA